MAENKIPYKIYLTEDEMPKQWYNLRADMQNKPASLLNPGTLQPMTAAELEEVFCRSWCNRSWTMIRLTLIFRRKSRDFYKMYRPSPLVRAYCLEENCKPQLKFTINLRVTTHPVRTS